MAGMYNDLVNGVSENIKINGYPFYAENITSDEPFNRRELNRTSIQGGTEHVSYGKYIPRTFNFTTTVYHPKGKPHIHDKILEEIVSQPARVRSMYMGRNAKGSFKAEVTIQKNFEEASPNHYSLDVSITEIPNKKSNIKGESFTVPSPKKIEIKLKKVDKNSKNKDTTKKNTKANSKAKVTKKSK